MSGYSQPGLRNLGPQNSSSDMFKNPMIWGVGLIVIASILGIMWYLGYFSSEGRSNRTHYPWSSSDNVFDPKNLNRIRANEFSALRSENEAIVGTGGLYAGGGSRKIPSYPLTSIPENPISESSTIIPPLPISTTETQAQPQPMMPELPGLTNRYTNKNYRNIDDLNNPVINSSLGQPPIPPYGSTRSRRTVPY
jgi:hypothetical protein